MGSSSSKQAEAKAAAEQQERELEAAAKAHFEQVQAQINEAFEEGRVAGAVEGRHVADSEWYDSIAYFGLAGVGCTAIAVFMLNARHGQRIHALMEELAKVRGERERDVVTFRTAAQRVQDAERAMEDQRVEIARQRAELDAMRKANQTEVERRRLAMRSAVASKRRLRAALRSQQRLTAELATYKMGAGVACIAGVGFLGVTFGGRLMAAMHGHGHGHAPAETPAASDDNSKA
mmetsp:Transcript_46755/g.144229  ORF Transcript_46755/g.144229 Transcript_46755/m.144229 type:complete len:234 (-) Transcript_46755:151-852(-)|eukprot:CAMPEP_0174846314 /NCGR_PEP_ID=MMETSP1114-20130205/12236_1 /TAXON_ID=312471 /ORGANISM="Neobodo designis, Strain CCAP 1951/1" /LENGTH=233 /DNA_ID=CAMNT_0016080577 /DNA_START=52 /DNA_END=753 /DNA_ORIENTATION=+